MGEIEKLRTIYKCPDCGHRYWLVLQIGNGPAHCECANCGWDDEIEMEAVKGKKDERHS